MSDLNPYKGKISALHYISLKTIQMGDTDATLTTGALAGPGAGSADGNTTGTRGGASTSEPGVGGAAKGDVKTEVEQRSGPNVRLPLKQAVELEMGHLDAALERIDSDIVFMHNLVDRRREYLVGALQRLKINRGTSHSNTRSHAFQRGTHTHGPAPHTFSQRTSAFPIVPLRLFLKFRHVDTE